MLEVPVATNYQIKNVMAPNISLKLSGGKMVKQTINYTNLMPLQWIFLIVFFREKVAVLWSSIVCRLCVEGSIAAVILEPLPSISGLY